MYMENYRKKKYRTVFKKDWPVYEKWILKNWKFFSDEQISRKFDISPNLVARIRSKHGLRRGHNLPGREVQKQANDGLKRKITEQAGAARYLKTVLLSKPLRQRESGLKLNKKRSEIVLIDKKQKKEIAKIEKCGQEPDVKALMRFVLQAVPDITKQNLDQLIFRGVV